MKVTAVLAVLVAVAAFVLNGFLVFSAIDGKHLIEKVEADAGRELSGYELYSEYREVNDYYYPNRELQGDVLYFHGALFWPWIVVSIGCVVALLCIYWRSTRLRAAGFGSLAVMTLLLAVAAFHSGVIEKIAWAIE